MTQPEIPGTDLGKVIMLYGSDGSNWIALLIDALGRLQVDAEIDNFPADPATQTTLAALLTELQLKADLTETQPVSATVEAKSDDTFTHDAVTMGLAAAVIKAANASRLGIAVFNLGSATIYLGYDNSVAVADGFPLLSGTGLYFDGYVGALWGISGTASQDVRYLEV